MGFAVDLGMIYAIKGELKTAANSMALAQAANLIGTDTGLDTASTAGQITVDNSDSFGNRFYFHGYAIGQTTGSLESVISQPACICVARRSRWATWQLPPSCTAGWRCPSRTRNCLRCRRITAA